MDRLTAGEVSIEMVQRPPGVHAGPLALAMGSTAVATLPVFLLGGLAVLVRSDLAFSQTMLGVAAATFWAAATATSAAGGHVVERMDPRRAIALTGLAGSLVFIGIGVLARSWFHLMVFMGIGGILVAFGQPAANLLITEAMPRHRKGMAFGIKQSSVPLATLLAGAAVPLVAVTLGWRWAFGIAAVPALAVFLFGIRRSGKARDVVATRRPRPLRPLVLLAVLAGFGGGAGNAMGAFYVDSSVTAGFEIGFAGALLALGGASSIVLRIGLGLRADRREGGDLGVISALLLIGAVAFMVIPLTSTPAMLVVVTFVAFVGGWSWNGLLLRTVVIDYPHAPAAATGITQTGVYAGAVIGPLCFGVLAERASYTTAWWFMAAWLLIGSAIAGWLRFGAGGVSRARLERRSERHVA